MDPLGPDVRRELCRFGPQAGLADLVAAWPSAVGTQIAAHAWPARIRRDGMLVVHASSAAWAFELAQLEETVRERLGAHAPPRLKFVVGPLPEAAVEADDARPPALPRPTTEHTAEAARLSAGIADPDLRGQVAKAIELSLARARSDRPF
jgi:Dna[CI] antecedent, DciA